MSLQFMDSCEHYDVFQDITAKWTANIINSSNPTASGRNGRGLNVRDGVGKALIYNDKWVCGAAMNFNSNGGFSANNIITFSAANELTLGALAVEADGSLSLYAGNRFTLIANSAPFYLHNQRWYYIECKIQITAGTPMGVSMDCHVNGVSVCSGSGNVGKNTADTLLGLAQANYITFSGAAATSSPTIMDDFYMAAIDSTGTLNDFAGDIAISALFPRADNSFGWTAVGGSTTTGWDHVNPQFPETNDDTIYIKDNNPGDVADFDWQPVPVFSGVIVGVHYGVYARKDSEGTRTFQQTTQGTANGPVISPGDSYQYYFFAMDADPSTGVRWTQAGFNGSDFGVNLVS